jgi:hypothetical protein
LKNKKSMDDCDKRAPETLTSTFFNEFSRT